MINLGILEQSRIYPAGGGVIPDDYIMYYQFEDNNNDSGPWGLDLPSGGTYSTGHIGKCVNVANTDINISDSSALTWIDDTNNWAVSLWIKTTETTNANRIIFAVDGANINPYKRIWLYYNGDTKVLGMERYRANTMGSKGGIYNSTDSVFDIWDGDWHHIVYNYDNATSPWIFIYVDNVLQSTADSGWWPTYGNATMGTGSTTGFSMSGNMQNNASGITGSIDNTRIYDRILTTEEIAALYNES